LNEANWIFELKNCFRIEGHWEQLRPLQCMLEALRVTALTPMNLSHLALSVWIFKYARHSSMIFHRAG
jgi:hypothetical protein